MSKLIMLIGLPACGKSTTAKRISLETGAIIHSSDELRLELFGDYNSFDKNAELFKELHSRILSDLECENDCIYDATNLFMKRRKHFLSTIPKKVTKEALVIATTYEKCIERDSIRDKNVGVQVIKKMRENFQYPLPTEGFDLIDVVYTDESVKDLHETMKVMEKFKQDNPNHSLTLGKHCMKAKYLASSESVEIRTTLFLHDLGKLYTKTYFDKKGEATDIAHYYNHHNVSAYEFMFYFKIDSFVNDNQYICQLINYHMQPYFIETEKSKKKWLAIWGEKMYNDIMIVNKYDRLAH